MNNDVSSTNLTVNREDVGRRLSCFSGEYKMAEHFTQFREEELSKLLAKNGIARTARIQIDALVLLFGEY